jgi:vanillate O-demethylase ferredoxin subunit
MNPVRNAVLVVHRWTGLTVGIVIMLVALTGLAMVFRPQLEPALDRALHTVGTCDTRIGLDDLAARARTAHPNGAIRQLEIARAGFGPTVVRYADNIGVYVDPCNGRVLGSQDRWGGLFGTIELIHRWRFLGNVDVSETVAGTLSLTLAVIMVLGGLAIWWPTTRRQWKNAWKLRWSLKGAAFELNLHKTYGLYAALIILATTAASWTFVFDWARNTVYAVTASSPPAKKPRSTSADTSLASFETVFTRSLATAPKADDVTILLPKKPGDAIEVTVIESDAPHPNARSMVYLDAHSAQVLRFDPYANASRGYKVYRWLASLHMGYIGGVFGQVLLFAGVLAVPVLGYTGIHAYLRRRRIAQPERKFSNQTA